MSVVYLDASALVKLVVREAESEALFASLQGFDHRVTSLVGRIELERAVRRRRGSDAIATSGGLDAVLSSTVLIPVDVATAGIAAAVSPLDLRTMDAIHLATMLALQPELECCFCYDHRLATAVGERGIEVRAPQ